MNGRDRQPTRHRATSPLESRRGARPRRRSARGVPRCSCSIVTPRGVRDEPTAIRTEREPPRSSRAVDGRRRRPSHRPARRQTAVVATADPGAPDQPRPHRFLPHRSSTPSIPLTPPPPPLVAPAPEPSPAAVVARPIPGAVPPSPAGRTGGVPVARDGRRVTCRPTSVAPPGRRRRLAGRVLRRAARADDRPRLPALGPLAATATSGCSRTRSSTRAARGAASTRRCSCTTRRWCRRARASRCSTAGTARRPRRSSPDRRAALEPLVLADGRRDRRWAGARVLGGDGEDADPVPGGRARLGPRTAWLARTTPLRWPGSPSGRRRPRAWPRSTATGRQRRRAHYLFGNTFEQNLEREGWAPACPCSATLMFARPGPGGQLSAAPEDRTATRGAGTPRRPADRVAGHAENPMQPRYLNGQWVAATKVDGYWGGDLTIDVAVRSRGPWSTSSGAPSAPGRRPADEHLSGAPDALAERRDAGRQRVAERPQHDARRLPPPGAVPPPVRQRAVAPTPRPRRRRPPTTTTTDDVHDHRTSTTSSTTKPSTTTSTTTTTTTTSTVVG